MTRIRRDKGFIENQCSILESRLKISILPLILRFAHGKAAVISLMEIGFGPLQLANFWRRRAGRFLPGLRFRYWQLDPHIAFDSGIRPAGTKAVERIDSKRQMLEFDVDGFNSFGGGEFIDGGDRKNRLALIQRLVGECFLALWIRFYRHAQIGDAVGRRGKIILSQDRFHAGHCHRFA